jgi:hypothetical protein
VGNELTHPNDWFTSCVLGTIWPSFFLLPLRQGKKLEVSIYEEGTNRKKQDALQIRDWKDDEWPPEQIIQYYGPATWVEDGSWAITPQSICSITSFGFRQWLRL